MAPRRFSAGVLAIARRPSPLEERSMKPKRIAAACSLSGVLAFALVYANGCATESKSAPTGGASPEVRPASVPSQRATGAAASRPGTGRPYEAASTLVPAGSLCSLHPAGQEAREEDLHLYADEDGVARFYVARPQNPGDVEALTLDCFDPEGARASYTVDLRASETYAPRPFDPVKAKLERRPGLEGDPMGFSREELIARGYGLRPDPAANPSGYARWLTAARVDAHKLRSVPRRTRGEARPRRAAASVLASAPELGAGAPELDAGEISGDWMQPWTGAVLRGSYAPNANPALSTRYIANEAMFKVPGMKEHTYATGNTAMSVWNGLNNHGLFQAIVDVNTGPNSTGETLGIHRQLFEAHQHQDADGFNNSEGVNFTPRVNDVIYSQEWYCDAKGAPDLTGGYACSSMNDIKQGIVWDCHLASDASCVSFAMVPSTPSDLGQQAEFIIEQEGNQAPPHNNSFFWADFSATTMNGSALVATGSGVGSVLDASAPGETWATTTTDPSVEVAYDWTPPADPSHVIVSLTGSDGVSWNVAPTLPCTFGKGGTPTGPDGVVPDGASFSLATASTACTQGFDYAPGAPVQLESYTLPCATGSGWTMSTLVSGEWVPVPNACSNGAQPGQCGTAIVPNEFVVGWQDQGATQSGLGIGQSQLVMVCDAAGDCSPPFYLTATDCHTPVSSFSFSPDPLSSPAGGPGPNATIVWTNAPTDPKNFVYSVNNPMNGVSAGVSYPYFTFVAVGTTPPQTINYVVTATWSGLTFTAPMTVDVTQCIPQSTSAACGGRTCGPYTDDCGNPVECGTCPNATPFCEFGQCVTCPPRICPVHEYWDPATCRCMGCPCGGVNVNGHFVCRACPVPPPPPVN
jgi:hypothetical protein